MIKIKKDQINNEVSSILAQKDYDRALSFLTRESSSTFKGDIFELFLAEMFRGNGWLTRVVAGNGDLGADILLYHPSNPKKVKVIVQAKNHGRPLAFDDCRLALVKLEEKAAGEHDCSQFMICSVSGFVDSCRELEAFNLSLLDFKSLKGYISSYSRDNIVKPEVLLYSHNKLSYEAIKRDLENHRFTCVVQATGTGKSFIIARLVQDYICKRVILVSPSNFIFLQFKKNFTWIFDDVEFVTFQGLLSSDSEDLAKGYDLIVIDEFHRYGASQWGPRVNELIKLNPKAKVVGTSATPIRYLDNSRNIVNELFEGRISYSLPLPKALVKGILPNPVYVSALFDIG